MSLSFIDPLASFVAAAVKECEKPTAPSPVEGQKPLVKVDRSKKDATVAPKGEEKGNPSAPSAEPPRNMSFANGVPIYSKPIGAKEYLAALNSAGKRKYQRQITRGGKVHICEVLESGTEQERMADERAATHAFIGWRTDKHALPHGAQVSAAKRRALESLKPTMADSKIAPSVAGFIAGIPNAKGAKVADLLAREELAVSEALRLRNEANATTGQITFGMGSEPQMVLESKAAALTGAALFEMARLREIRRELIAVGVSRQTDDNGEPIVPDLARL